jgi:hypothetical protein
MVDTPDLVKDAGKRPLIGTVRRRSKHVTPLSPNLPDLPDSAVQPALITPDQHHPYAERVKQDPGSEADTRTAADDDGGGPLEPGRQRRPDGYRSGGGGESSHEDPFQINHTVGLDPLPA